MNLLKALATVSSMTLVSRVLGFVRDTQNYIQAIARGLTIFDVAPGKVERDLQQWQAICQWLDA